MWERWVLSVKPKMDDALLFWSMKPDASLDSSSLHGQSLDECEHLINLATPHMEKSAVVDNETGKSKYSRVRTSSGTYLARGLDKTISAIEKRIADLTFLPKMGKDCKFYIMKSGRNTNPTMTRRRATVLTYLSDVEEGGETVFPAAKGNISAVPWWNELSECGKDGLSVKPKMGDALLFWSMKPDAFLRLFKFAWWLPCY